MLNSSLRIKIISETTAIGIKINNARKIKTHIAVAGGNNKVESIIATEYNDYTGVLVTDEAAAKGILDKLGFKTNKKRDRHSNYKLYELDLRVQEKKRK